MTEFTQEQLDEAVKEAVESAKSGMVSSSEVEAQVSKAVTDAMSKAKQEHEADKAAAVAKEKSIRDEINERLKKAKKQQVPNALEGLDPDTIDGLIEAAGHLKGFSDDKRTMFLENVASGRFQNMLVEQKQSWINSELKPLQQQLESVKSDLSNVRKEALSARRTKPLAAAVLEHCNPDKYVQEDALRRLSDMFEAELNDEGQLVPKEAGPHLGICPQTNTKFTPDTAAKYLAREISHFAKPSSSSDAKGSGNKPREQSEILPLGEAVKGKSKEEKIAILQARKASGG